MGTERDWFILASRRR